MELRSLIKSNWETSIRYRVYSPEKINQKLQRGFGGGLWERGRGLRRVTGRPSQRGHRASLFLPSWSQGKVSQAVEATTTLGMPDSGQWGREWTGVPWWQGDIYSPKHFVSFSILKCAWLTKHLSPQIFPDFFLFLPFLPSLLKFRPCLCIQHMDCFWWQEFTRTYWKNWASFTNRKILLVLRYIKAQGQSRNKWLLLSYIAYF